MAKKPLCCTIDYDTKDGTNWKASILAYSIKEAITFIRTNVNSVARINATEAGREIDAIETTVRKDFFTENVVEEVEVEIPVEVIKEVEVRVPVEADGSADPTCPWCKKTFKSEKTLKTHCIKYHLKD